MDKQTLTQHGVNPLSECSSVNSCFYSFLSCSLFAFSITSVLFPLQRRVVPVLPGDSKWRKECLFQFCCWMADMFPLSRPSSESEASREPICMWMLSFSLQCEINIYFRMISRSKKKVSFTSLNEVEFVGTTNANKQ